MTDEQIDAVFDAMPQGANGFLKDWGYRQFAHALLEAAAVAFVRGELENNSPTNIRSPFNACMYRDYCKTLADIPESCEVLPRVPTVRMVEAAEALGDGAEPRAVYTAMVNAIVKP